MKALRGKEILCVILTVAFIFGVTRRPPPSETSAAEMAAALLTITDVSELHECKNAEFKREFRLNPNDYDGMVYYSSDDVMEVRELLVVRLANDEQAEPLMERIRSRAEEKIALFDGYAPKQEALLDAYVLEHTRGFVLFAVCDEPSAVVRTFQETL